MAGFALVWLLSVLALASWLITVPVVPALLACGLNRPWSPRISRRRAGFIALLPWLLPVATVAAACVLAGAKSVGWTADHCIIHGSAHPHLCFTHLPSITLTGAHWLATAAVMLFAAALIAKLLSHEIAAAHKVNALRQLARGQGRVLTLDDARPYAFAAGYGRSSVLVSRGLLQCLTGRERRMVLAHEFAHLRRGDPIKNLLLEVLLLLHTPSAAVRLRRAWHQALEERADDDTVARFGSDEVASLLLKITRLSSHSAVAPLSAIGADPVRRVKRLLAAPHEPQRAWVFEAVYGATLCAFALAAFVNHHLLETLLGLLLGG